MDRTTDAAFTMGASHTVCQDYALAQENRAVVCDGCSSSPHTDVGARLLAHVAISYPDTDIGDAIIDAASNAVMHASIEENCLDATLLRLIHICGSIRATVIGDGLVVGRRRSGGWRAYRFEFPSGAPMYLSYALSQDRAAQYVAQFGDALDVNIHEERTLLDTQQLHPRVGDVQYCIDFPESEFDLVLAITDGIFSFQNVARGGAVDWTQVVPYLLNVPQGAQSGFMQRRMRRFKTEMRSNGWKHDDDLGVAAILLGGVS